MHISGINPQSIRAQVEKILASENFVRSRRMQRFLEFIVEETLAGRGNQLGEYAIGVAVFDRGVQFEPALDPIVRNDARRLRMKLIEYYGKHMGPDHVLIDIPKGGYVPVFGPVLPETSTRICRVGVLPFENLSPGTDCEFSSRSICVALTARLTNLDGVEAVAHSYLTAVAAREVAADLHLSYIIQGTVAISGKRCWATVNLIRVVDGTQLWAREYDLAFDDFFRMQSHIAASVFRDVAAALRAPIGSNPHVQHASGLASKQESYGNLLAAA